MTNLVGAAHTVTATSGNGQTATVTSAFANPLVATVTDSFGNPVSGVTVTFTPPATGASGTFTTSATAVTGTGTGQATSNTYNGQHGRGDLQVVASATGATSANFAETNTAKTTGDTLSLISGSGAERHGRHGLHQQAGALRRRPVRQPGLGRDGHLRSPGHLRRLGHLHHLGHRVANPNGQATSNTYTANTVAGGPYNVVASAPGATPTINFSMTNLVVCGPHGHRDLGQRAVRRRQHGLHQQAGGHGHGPSTATRSRA